MHLPVDSSEIASIFWVLLRIMLVFHPIFVCFTCISLFFASFCVFLGFIVCSLRVLFWLISGLLICNVQIRAYFVLFPPSFGRFLSFSWVLGPTNRASLDG